MRFIVLDADEQAALRKACKVLENVRDTYPETDIADSMDRGIATIIALQMDVEICPVITTDEKGK